MDQGTEAITTEACVADALATEPPAAEPMPEVLKLTETQAAFAVKTSSTAEPTVFTASIFLPEGWQLREDDGSDSFPYLGRDTLFDMRYIYDETGSRVGAVGANCCTLENLGGDASLFEEPNAVYSWINLGSGFRVDTHEFYEPVESPDGCRNALSRSIYSAAYLEGLELTDGTTEASNPAILCENTDSHCYIVIELADDLLSDADLAAIASAVVVNTP